MLNSVIRRLFKVPLFCAYCTYVLTKQQQRLHVCMSISSRVEMKLNSTLSLQTLQQPTRHSISICRYAQACSWSPLRSNTVHTELSYTVVCKLLTTTGVSTAHHRHGAYSWTLVHDAAAPQAVSTCKRFHQVNRNTRQTCTVRTQWGGWGGKRWSH